MGYDLFSDLNDLKFFSFPLSPVRMVTSRLSLLLLLGGAKDKAQSSDSERTSSAHGMIAIDKLRL